VLPNLGTILNSLNRFFKYEVIGELWDMEKFSVKEAAHEPDVEKHTNSLYDLTKAICKLDHSMCQNPIKHWRNIKVLYEQLIIALDGVNLNSIEENNRNFLEGWKDG